MLVWLSVLADWPPAMLSGRLANDPASLHLITSVAAVFARRNARLATRVSPSRANHDWAAAQALLGNRLTIAPQVAPNTPRCSTDGLVDGQSVDRRCSAPAHLFSYVLFLSCSALSSVVRCCSVLPPALTMPTCTCVRKFPSQCTHIALMMAFLLEMRRQSPHGANMDMVWP